MATVADLKVNLSAGTAEFTGPIDKAEKDLQKMKRAAFGMYLETRTPLEQYTYKVERLHKMYAAGVVDMEVYGRKLRQLKQQFEAASTPPQPQQTGLAGTLGQAGAAAMKLGVSMQAVTGAVRLAEIGIGLFSGDIEKADQAARKLPLGIGATYQAMYDLGISVVNVFDKVGADAAKWQKQQDETEKQTAAIIADNKREQEATARYDQARTNAKEQALKTERDIAAVGLKGADAARLQEKNRHEDRLKDINAQEKDMKLTGGDAEALRRQEDLLNAAKMRQISEDETADALAKQNEEAEKLGKELEDAWKASAAGKAEDLIANLHDEVNYGGLEGRQKDIAKLADQGALPEQVDELQALDAELTAREKQKKAMEEGKKLTEEMQTPLEKYNQRIDQLNALFDAGAIDSETYSRAMEKEQKAYDDQAGADENKTRDSLAKAGGLSTEYAAGQVDLAALAGSAQSPQEKALNDINSQSKQQTRWLERIATGKGLQ